MCEQETKNLKQIVVPLLEWYDRGRRILPWREEPTPYHVWVSEIMLQQTRVEAVKPYYDRFMKELPDIQSLSMMEEERLLRLWEGLGYYNRARNLQKAAQIIVTEYAGKMPAEYEELLRLPGIGSYTAGAISSIAYGKSNPAVDGNVLRIMARLCLDERDILDAKVKRSVEDRLREIMPKERPGDFNQALMELGAMVCVPNGKAKCDECPWKGLCEARKEDRVMEFPKKAPKKPRTVEDKTVLILRDENRIALHKRPPKGLLAGMYEFPMIEGHVDADGVADYLRERGMQPIRIQKLEDSRHIFSHKEWHMVGFAVRVDELADVKGAAQAEELIYIDPQETRDRYPIPSAFAAYANYLEMKRGVESQENNSEKRKDGH